MAIEGEQANHKQAREKMRNGDRTYLRRDSAWGSSKPRTKPFPCSEKRIQNYCAGRMNPGDTMLWFLAHLDICSKCWERVYQVRKRESMMNGYYKAPKKLELTKSYREAIAGAPAA